jgi:hypothetical protein
MTSLRRARTASGAICLTALLACPPIAAASGTSGCRLITDQRGDATGPVGAAPSTPRYDITSADLATDDQTVVAVVRLAQVDGDLASALRGMRVRVEFDVDTADPVYRMFVMAEQTPGGTRAFWGMTMGDYVGYYIYGPAVATVDVRKNEVRMAFTPSLRGEPKRWMRGRPFTNLTATTQATVAPVEERNLTQYLVSFLQDNPLFAATIDAATTSATYVGGAPSCVSPR